MAIYLDNLTDKELVELHRSFEHACKIARFSIIRPVIACKNEVDKRLAERGLLDLRTGVLTIE